jgi:hypothetical protein
MDSKNKDTSSLVGGAILMIIGSLALLNSVLPDLHFWNFSWPLIIIVVGLLFFAGMLAGGQSSAPLAIPGSIITLIGAMMFYQNLFNHWESWSYGWTIILFSVGLGIFIMGWRQGNENNRRSGIKIMKTGLVLFIIFGAFFELIFASNDLTQFLFPIALILLGGWLVISRLGLLPRRRMDIAASPPQYPNLDPIPPTLGTDQQSTPPEHHPIQEQQST